MTTTEDSTRDQKMCEHLRTLEESGPMPTFDSIRPIANALYDFHESVSDRAGALGWLSEFGDDPHHYTELSLEFIDQARDLVAQHLNGNRIDCGSSGFGHGLSLPAQDQIAVPIHCGAPFVGHDNSGIELFDNCRALDKGADR